MRILLINQYAGSPTLGMEYRPHWLAREWQEAGHEVLVVAADWTHLRRQQPAATNGRAIVEGVPFRLVRVPRHHGNGPRRFANILAFATGLWARVGQLGRWDPDVVIASSTHPFDVRAAHRVARSVGSPFIHEVHDLWPLTPRLLGGLSPGHPMIRWMQVEEDFACRHADAVVSILPGTQGYLVGRGLKPEKWFHVSNGVPPDALAGPVFSEAADQMLRPLRIGYFGAHAVATDLGTLLDAARELKAEDVEFFIVGDGPEKPALRSAAADLPAVHLLDPIGQAEARSQMAQMDGLWWGAPDSDLYIHGVAPNKLFEYMAAGRPIVAASSAPNIPSRLADCDFPAQPSDGASSAAAIRRLLAATPEQRRAMGLRGQRYVRAKATYPVLAAAYLDVLQAARSQSTSSRTHPLS